MTIRLARSDDLSWMHVLNEEHAQELSSTSFTDFGVLVSKCVRAWVVEPDVGFLLVMDQTAAYDSPNFHWFKNEADRFLYVDRIVVAHQYRRGGFARALYETLFDFAQENGFDRIFCEVNADPPNPRSDAFHMALGFRRIGEARLEDRGKTVQYLERRL